MRFPLPEQRQHKAEVAAGSDSPSPQLRPGPCAYVLAGSTVHIPPYRRVNKLPQKRMAGWPECTARRAPAF